MVQLASLSAAATGPTTKHVVTGGSGKQVLVFSVIAASPMHFNFARDVVERWARERPDAPALWCVGEHDSVEQKLSFRRMAADLRRAACLFHQFGLRRGDRVLIIAPRVPQWWI